MKSEQFAKVFDSEKFGQILIMKDRNTEGNPSLNVHICIDGGNMNIALGFTDDEEGYEKQERLFGKADMEFAEKMVETQMWEMAEMAYGE